MNAHTQPQAVREGLCIGCGYCGSLDGMTMTKRSDGYFEPRAVNEVSDRTFQRIEAVCPGRNAGDVITPDASATEPTLDLMWGAFYDCMVGHSTDDALRRNGSSGGVISALAAWLIETSEVDGVVATFYDPSFPIGTVAAMVDSPERAAMSGGSKYSPAAPLSLLDDLRARDGRFAVIGKPCDIATLRRAMAAGDPVRDKIAYLLSFYCAGTPSDDGNRGVLDYMNAPGPDALKSFRHRGDGWPGSTRAIAKDGKEFTCTYNESWGKILRSHTHKLCIVCPDGIGEQADLVAADAWYGTEDGYPVFEEADGRSLIMTRTPTGRDLLAKAREAGRIECSALDVREIDVMQPGQRKRRRELGLRIAAYRLLGRHTPPGYNRKAIKAYQHGMTARQKFSVFYGTLKRIASTLFQ